MAETSDIASDFAGLPIGELIVNPLIAIAQGQAALNHVALEYLKQVGIKEDGSLETIPVQYDRIVDNGSGSFIKDPVSVDVPILPLVTLPNVGIDEANIIFDMEVKQQDSQVTKTAAALSVTAKAGWFWGSASITGSVSTSKENTRSSDKTAKYHIDVKAKQLPPSEGMSRLMDLLLAAIQPVAISSGG